MKIVDANALPYAVNSASEHHDASRTWLDRGLSGADTVGLAWLPMLAFVRLTTKHGLFPSPFRPADAMRRALAWCSAPGAVLVGPTARHGDVMAGLITAVGTGGTWTRSPSNIAAKSSATIATSHGFLASATPRRSTCWPDAPLAASATISRGA